MTMPYQTSGGRCCCVVGCNNNQRKLSAWRQITCQLHNPLKHEECGCPAPFKLLRFPKSPEIRIKWIRAVNRDNFIPGNSSVICTHHFKDKKPSADNPIPTLFLGYKNSETQFATRRQAMKAYKDKEEEKKILKPKPCTSTLASEKETGPELLGKPSRYKRLAMACGPSCSNPCRIHAGMRSVGLTASEAIAIKASIDTEHIPTKQIKLDLTDYKGTMQTIAELKRQQEAKQQEPKKDGPKLLSPVSSGMSRIDTNRVKHNIGELLQNSIMYLCDSHLFYKRRFTVEGMLKITVDENIPMNVNISKVMNKEQSLAPQIIPPAHSSGLISSSGLVSPSASSIAPSEGDQEEDVQSTNRSSKESSPTKDPVNMTSPVGAPQPRSDCIYVVHKASSDPKTGTVTNQPQTSAPARSLLHGIQAHNLMSSEMRAKMEAQQKEKMSQISQADPPIDLKTGSASSNIDGIPGKRKRGRPRKVVSYDIPLPPPHQRSPPMEELHSPTATTPSAPIPALTHVTAPAATPPKDLPQQQQQQHQQQHQPSQQIHSPHQPHQQPTSQPKAASEDTPLEVTSTTGFTNLQAQVAGSQVPPRTSSYQTPNVQPEFQAPAPMYNPHEFPRPSYQHPLRPLHLEYPSTTFSPQIPFSPFTTHHSFPELDY